MTLMALAFAFTAGAQGTSIHEYPWNPDFNNDTYIGSDDLMGLLSTYGTQFGLPPEPCTYDGTPLEELMAGITNGDIILDSIFIEYELEDISTYYNVGCPDPTTDSLIFANSMLLYNFLPGSDQWCMQGSDAFGFLGQFKFDFYLTEGLYEFAIYSQAISSLGFENDGFFGNSWSSSGSYSIPFPDGWYLDEEGIHIDLGWQGNIYVPSGGWADYANYLHILPYWHYAE